MNIVTNDPERIGRWIFQRTGGTYLTGDNVCIGLERQGQIVAGVLYDHFNRSSIVMTVAGVGQWLTREFLWAVFDYPFRQLCVKKVIGLVDSTNLRARRFDEHLGFILEGTIKDGGRYGDQLIYTMTKAQCRWLNAAKRPRVYDGKEQRSARYA